jgi:hypothetical protein
MLVGTDGVGRFGQCEGEGRYVYTGFVLDSFGNHSTTSVPLVSGVNLWLILERELGVHVH